MKSGPLDNATLQEIILLNQLFIGVLPGLPAAGFAAAAAPALPALPARPRQGFKAALRSCPFLLFRVADPVAPARVADKPMAGADTDAAAQRLITFALGFLWQLARSNPFAVQLVSGAQARWCEELAALNIAQLVALAQRAQLLPRLTDTPGFWEDLLGVSSPALPGPRRTLGIAGLQLIMSRARRQSPPAFLALSGTPSR